MTAIAKHLVKLKGCVKKKCMWDCPSFKSSTYSTLGKVHIYISKAQESWIKPVFSGVGGRVKRKGEKEYLSF